MKIAKKIFFSAHIIIALIAFVFIIFVINTEIIYNHQQIAWEHSHTFFKYYFSFAGGPSEYLTLFITQSFYINWLGSLVITAINYLITFFLYMILKRNYRISLMSYFILALAPVIFMGLVSDYNYHFSITVNLFLITVILFLCDLIKIPLITKGPYHILLGGILVYYISGGIYFLIYMLTSLILVIHSMNRKALINIIILLVFTGLLPYITNKFLFVVSLKMSYLRSCPEVAVMLRYSKPLLFNVGLALIPFVLILNEISKFLSTQKIDSTINKKSHPNDLTVINDDHRFNNKHFYIGFAIWIPLAVIIMYASFNPIAKKRNEIEYLAHLEKWHDIIKLRSNVNEYDRMVNFQYNRALLHTGTLLENLFNYEQLLGVEGLFLDVPFTAEVALPNSDLYFDLGYIDESQRLAFEAQTIMPNSP